MTEHKALAKTERLSQLAKRINAEHRACVGAVQSALTHAIEAGRLLAGTLMGKVARSDSQAKEPIA